MNDVINSLHAVRRGNKWYVSGGGGAGSPIHTFNSVEEMNAANLADGSIACVPSSGESGGGLDVIRIVTDITPAIENAGSPCALSTEESAAFTAAVNKQMPVIVSMSLMGQLLAFVTAFQFIDGVNQYYFSMNGLLFVFDGTDNQWSLMITAAEG